ncbi:MAG: YqiA/YcfP family alpha/beta fold hydrolase [Chloroflexota bacterium]
MNLLYLHGFASSPGSTKAGILRTAFAPYPVNYAVPDLNVPDFEHLTLTAMLERIAMTVRVLPPGPVGLIGSSFGGLAAVHFVDRYRFPEAERITHMALLAPALDFMANRDAQLGAAGMERWRQQGYLDYHHYAYDRPLPVHYGLVEDVAQYDSYAVEIEQPALIYHGLYDESVDYRQSVRFAEERPNVDLRLVESDHKLIDQTDAISAALVDFFGLKRA